MTSLRIALAEPLTAFLPGGFVEGDAGWELSDPAESLELKLCWTTDARVGHGDPVDARKETIENPGAEGRRKFRLELPEGPWSFEGKLFSLKWFVELSQGDHHYGRAEFVLSPTGKPIRTRDPEPEDSDDGEPTPSAARP
jgi:hypothetical protein